MTRPRFLCSLTSIAIVCGVALHAEADAPSAGKPLASTDRSNRPANLLLITLDTTRADRLGSYGYRLGATPRLDRLGREGVVVQTAMAVTPLTLPSHCSLMTGLYPPRHGVRDNADFRLPDGEVTLAERLRQAGYRTDAVVGSIVLSGALGISQGFDSYDEPAPKTIASGGEIAFQEILERRATEVTDKALTRLDAVGNKPFFLWVHYFDPHSTYDPPEPFRSRFAKNLYDGEIAYVDHEVGRLLDRLSAQQKLDTTLVVVIADHGESLGEHGEPTHGVFIYDATMHVPLLLRWPAKLRAGTRYRNVMSGVDLAPTILELLGQPPLEPSQGKSHAAALSGRGSITREPVYLETLFPSRAFGWSPLYGLRDEAHKYIAAPDPELFELAADPLEARNLLPAEPQRGAPWQKQLEARMASMGTADVAASDPADAERLERLRSLGYVSGGPASSDNTAVGGRDPKKMIAIAGQLDQARHLLTSQNVAGARQIAERILTTDPQNPSAHEVRGLALSLQGDREGGLSALQTAARLAPTTFEHLRNLGVALQQMGRSSEAVVAFRSALSIQPDAAATRFTLGVALLSAGDAAGAVSELQAAIRGGYTSSGARGALAAALERTGATGEAEQQLRTALVADPRAWSVWLQLGGLLERGKRCDEATRCVQTAYELLQGERPKSDPYLRVVHAQLGLLKGDTAGALNELEAVLAEKGLQREVAEFAKRLLRSARAASENR